MKTLREMMNLVDSAQVADGYLLMIANYPWAIYRTMEEAQIEAKEHDNSPQVIVPFQFGAEL